MTQFSQIGTWLSHPPPGEEVVVSGISGRYPESRNINEFRDNLLAKKDLVTDDDRRWKIDSAEVPPRNGKIYDINKLDAGYFGLHYRQVDVMDPQIRKFLETVIEAVLDAGVNPSELKGTRTGVFVGAQYSELECDTMLNTLHSQNLVVTGYMRSLVAHRVSYYLRLKGPSLICDTACSSSLNALEVAFRAIREGKCDSALVGGTTLLAHPGVTRQFWRLGVLSKDGACKVFDQNADGYARSEAVSCVFLQKAKDARRVYAQIIHSKVNSDGFKIEGITFPSIEMQERLMTDVYEESQIHPSEIDFLEAHGTGTEIGDPQEATAIDRAFAQKRDTPLLVGGVKCNTGHNESASGLCALAKVIIAMHTGYIPPNIHFNKPKKLDCFEQGRMKVVTEATELKKNDAIIAVNNFGFGGNNCQALVRRFPKEKLNKAIPEDNLPRLVCVSGRTEEAVLVLLGELNKKEIDSEFIGLLHHIFGKDIDNHLYRGFTILSKTNSSRNHVNVCLNKRTPLYVLFGKFSYGCKLLLEGLMEFPCFKSTVQKIKNFSGQEIAIDGKKNEYNIYEAFVAQIGIAEMLKLLDIEDITAYGKSFGKIVTAYYYDNITLEEAVKTIILDVKNSKDINLESTFVSKYSNDSLFENEFSTKGLVLNISDEMLNGKDVLSLSNNNLTLLEILGRLYMKGCNLSLHKLYPEIKFPVSRNTASISPLIKWDYRRDWYTYKFSTLSTNNIMQAEYAIAPAVFPEQKYMEGHIVDGRNLVPATEYLLLVWKTLAKSFKSNELDTSVVFENCRFIRATVVPKNSSCALLVSIQKASGYFEISEKNSILVTGRIYTQEKVEESEIEASSDQLDGLNRSQVLEQDEIYRELYLRGYNYTGAFKGLLKSNVDASIGLVRWEKNFTTFIDKMLQLKILEMDTRLLYVPTSIQKITIDPERHVEFLEKQKDSTCLVYNCKDSGIIRSGAIEVCGIKAMSINKRKPPIDPVLEKYVFVPNQTSMSLEELLRVNTQIILENSLEINFKAVEILDDSIKPDSGLLLPLVSNALDDLPMVLLNLTISTKAELEEISGITIEDFVLTPTSNLLLITATNILQRIDVLMQTLSALSPKGFLLTREEVDFCPQLEEGIQIITEYVVDNEKLILLRKVEQPKHTKFIEVSSTDFDWISELQAALKTEESVVVYSQKQEPDGILGLVNCIRREPQGNKVRCFFIKDMAPKFDPENPFYLNQLKKNFAINVYENGTWGTYRHLRLEGNNEVECEHVFANTATRGDLSSLKWFQGGLRPRNEVNENQIIVFPYYCSINFRDIMAASGRVNIDALTTDRMMQQCVLGFECSGIDIAGRRVAAIGASGSLSASIIITEKSVLWEIPEDWSLEDASTAYVVYLTVLFSLQKIPRLKPGMSILIHSATGGVGQAALNVCLHFGLEIFVTVGTQDKREYLRKNYPQIPESRIGNSRDTSFEQMIKFQTNGHGVDIVLNSLSEEKLRASIRCVASGGHFLEIGKYDMGIDAPLKTSLLERKVNFHGVMLDGIFNASTETKNELVKKLNEGVKLGCVKPLPRTVFQKDELEKAFRYMMTGKHTGKVLIKLRDDETLSPLGQVFKGSPRFVCDSEKSYIIIGGLGGFGLELADWLYLRGARNLVLVSRIGIQTGYQVQRINIWTSAGVSVKISTDDVTTKEGCLKLIKSVNELAPIDALFNLAVILKDALFADQTPENFSISLAPKAQATIFLDEITRMHCPELKYFVIFSSVSCGRGNTGQTNYGMANSIMERICEKRNREGLPGLAIQWGAIGDVGLVAKMQKENKELIIGGTLQQKISSCLEVLDKLLKQDNPVVSSMVVAVKNTKNFVGDSAVEAVAYILGIKDIKTVGHNTTFAEMGMDSMTGTETLQILEKDFDIFLSPSDMRDMTFAKLAELEEEKKKDDRTEIAGNIIIRFPPSPTYSESSIIKISSQVKDDDKATTVFVLPGIEGSLKFLEPFTANLKAHLFGLQYRYYDSEESIEETAEIFLPFIEEKLTGQSNFFIVGYSFGAIVGTELIALLESKGYNGKLIAIDGSPEYMKASLKPASLKSIPENELQASIIISIMSAVVPVDLLMQKKEQLIQCKSLEERMQLGTSLLPPNVPTEAKFEKEAVEVLIKRGKSAEKYQFNHPKIKSPVHLIKAKFPVVSDIEPDYKFSQLCEHPVLVDEVRGNHATMIRQEQLSDLINKSLEIK